MSPDLAPWQVMWTTALAIYVGCKWITWQLAVAGEIPPWKHAAYLIAWPGMDASTFLEGGLTSQCRQCRSAEWLLAAARLTLGVTLLFASARCIPDRYPYAAGWIGMIGLVLILHFGIFHLLSCGWRRAGVQARPLMNRPLQSTSLKEFWGRRWNTAFRDLTHRFLFRPCAWWLGARWGMAAGFLFSGAVHELVISVPARGGYGGPTAYFAIQGVAMVIERSALGRRFGLGSGRPGRAFAAAALAVPIGLLFHRPFVVEVIFPFMQVLGAL